MSVDFSWDSIRNNIIGQHFSKGFHTLKKMQERVLNLLQLIHQLSLRIIIAYGIYPFNNCTVYCLNLS